MSGDGSTADSNSQSSNSGESWETANVDFALADTGTCQKRKRIPSDTESDAGIPTTTDAITDNADASRKRKRADSDIETGNGSPSITRDDPGEVDSKVEVKIWPMGECKEPFIIRVDHDATMGQFESQLKTQTCTKNCVLITMFGNPVVYKMSESYQRIMLTSALRDRVRDKRERGSTDIGAAK